MSKSAYVRCFINGYEPISAPPTEYYRILGELRAIGNNINQIAHRANVTDDIRAEAYCKEYAVLTRITDDLTRAFLPRKHGC
ncbi:MAG: MobC family plasmid mobilization relaxosome protein [Coriobacteriia bacterium]|nr:MobC family plasmid mobilization relaxosome protein [Coriobacteriia bacterium]